MDQTSEKSPIQDAADLIASPPHAELVISPDLRIVACTDAYLQVVDVPREAIVGRSVREAFRAGPALDRLVASLELVRQSRRPQRMRAEAFIPSGASAATRRPP
ncbi:MAG TPA: hypothetical protein VK681_34170, partial [Reyranella sp.]|nr:hypothetical protein [Reyranella sp.]